METIKSKFANLNKELNEKKDEVATLQQECKAIKDKCEDVS